MKTHPLIITVAVVMILVLGGVAVRQNSKLTDATESLSSEKARNAELQGKVNSLEQEVAKLKETADYYYQQGVDLQSSGNLADAKAAFEVVVAKFPTSNLVGSAQQRLGAVNEAIAKAEADKLVEMQRQQEERENWERENGTTISYTTFRARALNSGLPIGKRFRFSARIDHGLVMDSGFGEGNLLRGHAAFDDEKQLEQFLQGPDPQDKTVVASMGADGMIQIHRIE